MADKLAGGVAQALDIVVKPLISFLVHALPLVYVVRRRKPTRSYRL